MEKCIYCLKEKNINEFNREHVISRFISTFNEETLVLNECEVCKDCNLKFSKEFEDLLAENSIVAQHIYKYGIKTSKKGDREVGKYRVANFGKIKEDEFESEFSLILDNNQENGFIYKQKPNIIFEYNNNVKKVFNISTFNDEYINSIIEEAKNFINELGYIVKININAGEDEFNHIEEVLQSNFVTLNKIAVEKRGAIPEYIEMEERIKFQIDKNEFRWIAKMCFNLIANEFGKQMVLNEEFNNIREFIMGKHTNIKYDIFKDSSYTELWSGQKLKHSFFLDLDILNKLVNEDYKDIIVISFEFDRNAEKYSLYADCKLFNIIDFKIEFAIIEDFKKFERLQCIHIFDCKDKKLYDFDFDYLKVKDIINKLNL